MRLLPDFIQGFQQYVADQPSPEMFKKWGAIACVAGALERKVWIVSRKMEVYPHLYTFLVGPPGVGKSVVLSTLESLWRTLPNHHIAPTSLSRAALMDTLADSKRSKTIIGPQSLYLEFNALLANVGELQVFLPSYDSEFMGALTYIWDGQHYEERRRGKDLHLVIKKPSLNLIGGTTPSYLNSMLPEGAWDQGFLARTFLVYDGQAQKVDLFGTDVEQDAELFSQLKSDLRDISELAGPMSIEPDAREALSAWHMAGGPPIPDHPKLQHYLTRRSLHLLKLCIIASASSGSNRVITLNHFQTGLAWLLEMEFNLPEIFKALGQRGDGQTIQECYHYLYKIWMATKEPLPEHRFVAFVSERVPNYSILRIIEIMEKAGYIEKAICKSGILGWIPKRAPGAD